jgi:zinc transporter
VSFDRLKPALDVDIPGGVFVLRFDEDGRATPGEASDVEKLGTPGEGFVWLHLNLEDVRVHGFLKKLGALSEAARETLTQQVNHQFIDHSANLVRGAIVDYERGLGGRLPQTGYLRFVFGERFLISARERPLESVEATRMALSAGRLAETPLDLFETVVGHVCDELGKIVFELSVALDQIEERIVSDAGGASERATLGVTRRSALRLAREIAGLRSPLLRLEATLSEPEHDELRETGARLAHRADILARDLGEVQDRARLLQDELNAITEMVLNDRLYVLTIVTTLLLPATFVTGFFGMNTRNLPFADAEWGTAFAFGLCIAAALAMFFFMRRMGLTRPRTSSRR